MKKLNIYPFIVLIILAAKSFPSLSQEMVPADTTNTFLLRAAREIIIAAGVCTLITIDEDGRARARAMDAFLPEEDFTIWFATNPKSRKVKQIEHDPRVTLYYFDKASSGYVMLHGHAQLIDNEKEKEMHWKEAWANFYPDYPAGYLLIKVVPDWLELISERHGIIGDALTWQPPIVHFNEAK